MKKPSPLIALALSTAAILSPLGAAVLVPAPALAQPAPLAQVQQHLRAVDTMVADFVQTDRMGKSVSGTITLKRPDYSVKQVSRWPIGNSPLSVLLDPNRDLSRFARVLPASDPRALLVEARDPKHPEYGTITIGFARAASAPAGLMLQGWSVLDAQNNRTTVRLSNQRFNLPVSDKAFRWSDPRPQGPRNR
jgi:outer membrane lipoprotein-sorting protein